MSNEIASCGGDALKHTKPVSCTDTVCVLLWVICMADESVVLVNVHDVAISFRLFCTS